MKGGPTEITNVYNKGNNTLVIPVYQRNYDWSEKQCARLWADLEDTLEFERYRHFFGAVVGAPESSWEWVVIDGQQRLTTVSLLMLALVHAIRNGDIEVEDADLASNIESDYLRTKKGTKFKLKPVKDDADAYRRLFENSDHFLEKSSITHNYRFFRSNLAATKLTADQVWNAISRLEVMYLDLEPHDDPQRIFESLNSTGLALSEADKIRNLVLMKLNQESQQRLYETRWNPMEHSVNFRTDWFIRWYLVSKTSKTPKESDVYEAFRAYITKSKSPIDEVLTEMMEYAEYASVVMLGKSSNLVDSSIEPHLHRARPVLGDVVLPLLLPVLDDVHNGVTTAQDFMDILRIVESMIVRRFVSEVAANALNKVFATAYSEIRRLRTHHEAYADILTYLLRRRDDSSGRIPSDSEFKEALIHRNVYRMRPVYRSYLFDALENGASKDTRDIATALDRKALSIEHIMPQTLTATWREDLGPNAEEIHTTWLHRLANLTVTGYNSEYKNSSFKLKKTMAGGFDSSPFFLNDYLKKSSKWTEEELTTRAQILSNRALELWPLPTSTFTPPIPVRPTQTLADDTNFTGMAISQYSYDDVEQTVSTWTDFVVSLLKNLATQYRSQLIDFADSESLLELNNPKAGQKGRRLRRIDDALSVVVANSTADKVAFLRRVFDALALNHEDLVIVLRAGTDISDLASDNPEETNGEQEQSEQGDHPFSPFLKHYDRLKEASELNYSDDELQAVVEDFEQDFAPFARENAREDLENKSIEEFTANTTPADATTEQLLALSTLMLAFGKMMGPSAVFPMVRSGALASWVDELSRRGVSS